MQTLKNSATNPLISCAKAKRIPILKFSLAAIISTGMAACVVAPVPYGGPPIAPAYGTPAGVVYVAPTYAVPGPGYVWAYNAHYGWGYHHPQQGWHRGWR